MCNACGFPPAVGHWTDAGGKTPHERLRIRFDRVAVLNAALKSHGFSVTDNGVIPGLQLRDGQGRVLLCDTLEEVWAAFEALSGTAFDPLMP